MNDPAIAPVAEEHQTAAVATLTMAFSADPVLRGVYPSPDAFLRHFPSLVIAFAGRAFEHGTADGAGGAAAVAPWLPPGVTYDEEALEDLFETTIGDEGREDRDAFMGQMDAIHPQKPHWYLPLIGVDPVFQGQGLGSALLGHRLGRCDADGVPAYLEATSPRNRDLYARHGFEVLGEIQAGASPPMWPMLRRPRG